MNLKAAAARLALGKRVKTEFVRALNGVTLDIKSGERILLSGPNGAGKTTLLKLLSGSIHPTTGKVIRSGTCLTLLNFGSSLDPHLTGYENIYRMGVLLGATPKEISTQVSNIADFTGLGSRLDHPIYTYSAGMKVRLSFSVATSVQREIVIVDEGLGFADSEFMSRAGTRLENFVTNAGILVVASHSAGVLENHITRRIELKCGVISNDSTQTWTSL